jgi:hypothetical protein
MHQAQRYAGQDIWIIASGPSAGYIDPGFFRGKTVIGVNRTWLHYPVTYICLKEHSVLPDAMLHETAQVVVSRYDCGSHSAKQVDINAPCWVFEHEHNTMQVVNLDVIGRDPHSLVVSYSTITTAMHLAAHMGAANIILVGHDCGTLDGQYNYPGYPAPLHQEKYAFYNQFLRDIEPQSLAVRERLQQVYGCRVYSLNPFLNPGLEGHTWRRTA